jgi:hypothetical protein
MNPPSLELHTLRQRLLGAWTLQRWTIALDDGRAPQQPFGEGATGLIVYTADGWMSAAIARADRAPLSAASVRQVPVAEQAAAFEGYFHYAGRFSLALREGVPHVVHQVQWSLNPGFVGSEQVRRLRFDGEQGLELAADEPVGGQLRAHRLAWQRAA